MIFPLFNGGVPVKGSFGLGRRRHSMAFCNGSMTSCAKSELLVVFFVERSAEKPAELTMVWIGSCAIKIVSPCVKIWWLQIHKPGGVDTMANFLWNHVVTSRRHITGMMVSIREVIPKPNFNSCQVSERWVIFGIFGGWSSIDLPRFLMAIHPGIPKKLDDGWPESEKGDVTAAVNMMITR